MFKIRQIKYELLNIDSIWAIINVFCEGIYKFKHIFVFFLDIEAL